MKKIQVLALLLLAPLVFSATEDFTIEPATERVNGDALALSEIASHKLLCGTVSGGPYPVGMSFEFDGENPTRVTTGDVFGTAGEWFCVGRTVDTDGRESANGDEINFTVGRCEVSDCRPKPPVISVQ